MPRSLPRPLLALALLGLTACGAAPAPEPPAPARHDGGGHHGGAALNDPSGPVVLFAAQSAPLGVVATDGGGRLLYRSDADSATPPTSNCTGTCTATWTPLLVAAGQKIEYAGVPADRVGRLQRADGTTQLTIAGWPVYVRPDDDGQLRDSGGNGTDGHWAVTPTGDKATAH